MSGMLAIVVPHEETWIEIPITYAITVAPAVVPYAGTWIEMQSS